MVYQENDHALREAAAQRAKVASLAESLGGVGSFVGTVIALTFLYTHNIDINSLVVGGSIGTGIILPLVGLSRGEDNKKRAEDLRAGREVQGTEDYFRGSFRRNLYLYSLPLRTFFFGYRRPR